MAGRSSEAYPARPLHGAKDPKLRYRILHRFVPFEGLKHARERVVSLFAVAYTEIDEVENEFTQKSNSEIRDWATEPCPQINDYDPHEKVKKLLKPITRLIDGVTYLSKLLALLGNLLAVKWLYTVGSQGLGLIETLKHLLPIPLLLILSLLLWFWRADTFAHRLLSRELQTGYAKVNTRRRHKIVGYGVWNRSLLGQAGLFLVGFFYILDSLPNIPILGIWFNDPAEYVTSTISENIDLLYEVDGWKDAAWRLFKRQREDY